MCSVVKARARARKAVRRYARVTSRTVELTVYSDCGHTSPGQVRSRAAWNGSSESQRQHVADLTHPAGVFGTRREEHAHKDVLHQSPKGFEADEFGHASQALALKKAVGHGAQRDVMVPPRIGAPFEMIDAEFGLELLVLLFDGPPFGA
jgi:hypothetical protein